MRDSVRTWGFVLALGLALGWGLPAGADLYRCKGPDGRTVFTDQKSACPSAEAYQPKGRVTSAPAAPRAPRPAARAQDALAEETEAALAEEWRQKRVAAEEKIASTQERREHMRPFVTHCNRGGYVTTRDDAGLKRRVPCNKVKADFAALDEEEAAARRYLEGGLAEECRKAGCLPGWIR